MDKNEFGSYAFKGAFHGVGAGTAAQITVTFSYPSKSERARAKFSSFTATIIFQDRKSKKGQYGIFKHRTAVYRAKEFVEIV